MAAQVGLGLAKAILGIADRRVGRMGLDQLARATPQLGGSHIQRDVFVRTLALLAADQGDRAAVARILAQRTLIGREDRFSATLQAQARRGRGLAARLMSPAGPTAGRDPRLDVARGLAMAIILIAHIPGNPVIEFIPARFGPSDATEMFVFCSGFASALAFGGTFARAGFAFGTLRIAHRCWQIYWSHLALFVTVAALCVAGSALPGAVDYVHALWLQPFFAEPRQGLLHLVTLTYVPNYFDILPMYLVVLAMVPGVMALGASRAGRGAGGVYHALRRPARLELEPAGRMVVGAALVLRPVRLAAAVLRRLRLRHRLAAGAAASALAALAGRGASSCCWSR